ncbi:MAG: hypothetical protein HY297_04830 [Thaumarchaeota archaeon]|nr:hypothetical protein [Nitrososphaerota archaeon]
MTEDLFEESFAEAAEKVEAAHRESVEGLKAKVAKSKAAALKKLEQ